MNEKPRTQATNASSFNSEGHGSVPADELSAEELREAERLGDGSPAVEPREPEDK